MNALDIPSTAKPSIQRWSTDDLPAHARLDSYGEQLSNTLSLPRLRIENLCDGDFHAKTETTELGPFSIIRQHGSSHRATRCPDAARHVDTRGGSFSFIVNVESEWTVTHRDVISMQAGDGILTHSDFSTGLDFSHEYEISVLTFSEPWLQSWVPAPQSLVGRKISCDTGWGRALTSFVGQLSPQLIDQSPVPIGLLVDHVGSLLSMVAAEMQKSTASDPLPTLGLRERIIDMITQRLTEPDLCPADVAAALNVSTRTLHRTLAKFNESFGSLLMAARARTALRMLESPLFNRLTTEQIGRRAGFKDQSHFSRTMYAHCGATPTRLRRAARSAEA